MKTTKKLLAMALAAAMVVTAFAGCSGNNDTSSADSTSSASSEASTSSDASTSDESSATEDDAPFTRCVLYSRAHFARTMRPVWLLSTRN